MKGLIWWLIVSVSTALAQVSPVDARLVPAEKCTCCEEAGDCGMPDCGVPAAPVQVVSQPPAAAPSVAPAAKRGAPLPPREKFYAKFLPRPAIIRDLPVESPVAPAPKVPRFREHCRLLI